jgi:hypothetical protein
MQAGTSSKIQIGPVSAGTNEVARGFLTVGETAAGPVQLPIVIINGAKEGPVLCLTAGVHATEYASIDALMRLINQLKPADLSGTIIAVPVVNLQMFAGRTPFVSPIDGVNLNKIAPGGDGSMTERVAQTLFDDVITRAEYHIDLHAGDFGELLLPFAACSITGSAALDKKAEALARVFTPNIFCVAPIGTTLPPPPGFVANAAARKGVVSILAEAGGNGTMEQQDVQVHLAGMLNVLRYLGMIEGEPVIRGPQLLATDWHNTRASRAGLLRRKIGIGDEIATGQEVAEICDVFGRTVEVVHAEKAGVAMLVWAHNVVNTGDPIMRCWTVQPAPAFPETDRFMR